MENGVFPHSKYVAAAAAADYRSSFVKGERVIRGAKAATAAAAALAVNARLWQTTTMQEIA